MSADVLFECFTILTERNLVFGTTIRVVELPFSASVALQESASHFYNSREKPLFFDPFRLGDSDNSFIRRLRATRAWKARPHCSKRSQYRRAWRQIGKTCKRASSEVSFTPMCRYMTTPSS